MRIICSTGAAVLAATLSITASSATAPTDAQIADIVVTANQVDIDAGTLARQRARSGEVRQFAQLMITDHSGVNRSAGELATRLHITPDPNPTSAQLRKGGDENRATLEGLTGGAFDKAYIDHEVAYHQAVLDAVDQSLIPNARNPELKALLVKVRPALQEAYVAAFRKLDQYRGDAALGTWLARILLNECGARQRRSMRRDSIVPMISLEAHPMAALERADEREQPESAAARAQLRALLEERIGKLPEGMRLVFVLRCVEELSVAETAECLGISAENVRIRFFRARELLRRSLAEDVDAAERDLFQFGGCDCDAVIVRVLSRLRLAPA